MRASGSVQPEITNSSQLPSSVLAHGRSWGPKGWCSPGWARGTRRRCCRRPRRNGEGVEVLCRRIWTAHALTRPVVDGGGRVVVERLGVGAPRQFVCLARPVVRVGKRVVIGGKGSVHPGTGSAYSHRLKSPSPKIWANGSKLLAAGSGHPTPKHVPSSTVAPGL